MRKQTLAEQISVALHVETKRNTKILDCGHQPNADPETGDRGYGTDSKGKKYCYECCAKKVSDWINPLTPEVEEMFSGH